MNFTRVDSNFASRGTLCAAWLYLPDETEKPPVLVMAHGFACEKNFGLPAFAERFVEMGIAVFVFDYRNFGESDGGPRNLVSYRHHLLDWEAAIAYVKSLPEVDGTRMALWGASYSGGHVIAIAARHPELTAVLALVPLADGMTSLKTMKMTDMLKLVGAGLWDALHMLTLRPPYRIPVVARPGEFACMNSPGTYEGYLAMIPAGSTWKNNFPARSCLTASCYRPIKSAGRINAPVAIIMGEYDKVIFTPSIRAMAAAIHDCQLTPLPMGHFDFYRGEWFERVVKLQSEFLRAKLL